MNVSILLLFGLLSAQDPGTVDPRLVGSWETTVQNAQGIWVATWTLQANGEFRTVTRGPAPVPDDVGTFQGRDGRWKIRRPNGLNDEGTYILDGDTLTFTGKQGVLSFKRVRAALARSEFPALEWDFGKAPPPRKGLEDYLEGLDALGAGSFGPALEAFGRATAADEESPDYHVARGVALAFLERISEAGAALERADRLRGNHEETRLWLASVVAMNGDFPKDADLFPYATNDPYQSAVRKMSRDYGGLAYFRRKGDRAVTLKKHEQEREVARASFPAVAAAFAARAKLAGGTDLAARIYRRGVDRVARGEHVDGLRDLEYILALDPDVPGALAAAAMAQVCLGDSENGRLNLTRVLGMVPDHASS